MAAIFDSFPFDTRSMDEQDWKLMFSWVRSDGILYATSPLPAAGASAVAPDTGMILQIYPGEAWIQGFYFSYIEDPLNPGNYQFSIGANTDPNPRIDLVILRLDLTLNTIGYSVLQGTPAASPIDPLLTQNNLTWEIAIARVYVASGATVINAGNITDLRVQSTQTTISPSLELDDLSDVTIASPIALDYLGYDDGTGKWVNKPVTADISLDDLLDVTISAPADNEFLVYDNGTSKWVNNSASGILSLNDLSDVNITSPIPGNYLRWEVDELKWVNHSRISAELYDDSNSTATTFTNNTSYIPMLVDGAGTLVDIYESYFSQTPSGSLKYIYEDTLFFNCTATLSIDASAVNTDMDACFLLNGAFVPGSLIRNSIATSGRPQSTAINAIIEMTTNDVLTIGLRNRSWTTAQTITILAYNMVVFTT